MWCTIQTLDQALKHGLVLKKVHRVDKFSSRVLVLKVYIDKNTELRKKATKATRTILRKTFSMLINNTSFWEDHWKTKGNIKTHGSSDQ